MRLVDGFVCYLCAVNIREDFMFCRLYLETTTKAENILKKISAFFYSEAYNEKTCVAFARVEHQQC